MLTEIILKEIQEQISTLKMIFSAVIIILVMLINAIVFNYTFDKKQTAYENECLDSGNSLKAETGKLIHLFFHRQRLTKPPARLGFISESKDNVLPNGITMNYFEESQPQFHQKEQNKYLSLMNALDWSYILIYIISFICLAFSYNAFSGEKEKGTLKLMLSNSLAKGNLIFGKFIGILICISISFIIGLILNLIIIQLNPAIQLTPLHYVKILIYLLNALLFMGLNILLGFLISGLTFKPIHSLNLLLICWIFFSIIIPNISWVFAKKIFRVPSEADITEMIDTEVNKIWSSNKYYTGWQGNWEGQPPNEKVRSRAEGGHVRNQIQLEIRRDYLQQKFRQTRIAVRLAKISPFSVFRFIGERVADNGYSGYERFYEQARNYRTIFNTFLLEKDQQDPDSYHLIWNEQWASRTFGSQKPVDFEEIPQFQYSEPGIGKLISNSAFDFLILFLWCLFLFYGTFVAFLRYDVR